MRALHDGHGRSVRYLRLSVTDRCNLRCLYCRSNAKQRCIPHEQVLRYEEMARMVGIAASLGIGKVRLTGGEPFARKGCGQFLAMLHARFPDMDLRVTTNGTLLEPHIPLLRRIGVSAVNLSLDSFDRETFARVTGRDLLPPVLAALDGLLAAGVRVKINVVAMRGVNDGQMDDFVHAARTMPLDLRFIEFMPMGSGTLWSPENFWSADDIREEAARRARSRSAPTGLSAQARRITPARISSVIRGWRSRPRKRYSLSANRQVRNAPSLVRRRRLQVRQK